MPLFTRTRAVSTNMTVAKQIHLIASALESGGRFEFGVVPSFDLQWLFGTSIMDTQK